MTRLQDRFGSLQLGNGLITVIILLGYAVRLYKLGVQSLWYDESVSAYLASLPPAQLIEHTARDIHPPGYYLLLHYWATVFGRTEFALALLSVAFGVLLIPLSHILARYLANRKVAIWSSFLVAISPFNLWYSQEVRMYTLGAAVGMLAIYLALRALSAGSPASRRNYWLGYTICATLGLYALYYYAFLLLAINLTILIFGVYRVRSPKLLKPVIFANALVVIFYLPWIPVAWRQASNPPVPPWRSLPELWSVVLESWTALSLGQSVDYLTVWPLLLLSLVLFIVGLRYLSTTGSPNKALDPVFRTVLLVAYTFGPLLLIYLISFVTPLYHVRYLFTYSPAFYIVAGAGLVWLTRRRHLAVAIALVLLLSTTSLYSIYQFHFNARYQADDFRTAVNFIRNHWQPGDVILANAGYTYPAFQYYAHHADLERRRLIPYLENPVQPDHLLLLQTGTVGGSPQLGWADPRADFYAMSEAETLTALEQLSREFPRLWVLRAYDTVTDPEAVIRTWLAKHTIPIEDQLFSGTANIRAQGFLSTPQNAVLDQGIPFRDGMVLAGWQVPDEATGAGQPLHIKLWWSAAAQPQTDYKMSLKLWTAEGRLVAQGEDDWPGGTLFRATSWLPGDVVYQPAQINLPANTPPGQYWLNVELYHPDTIQPLPRADNGDPAVMLGPITVEPPAAEIRGSTNRSDSD